MTNFEPLREMSTFTEDMFNRIITFQEKEHPAWNTTLAFEQRIKELPLHNLIFSNPDRDPEKSGPTVAPFYPLREEIQKIAHYVQQVAEQPILCDLFPGNGFIGSLIGREEIQVVGLNHPEINPNQIESFYDNDCFAFSEQPLSQQQFDAALISWPPSGVNPSTLLTDLQAKLLIYIFTDHVNESSGQRQTGTEDMLSALEEDYREIDAWNINRPKDLLHEIWPDMTPSIEETRKIRIYLQKSATPIMPIDNLPPCQAYDWEKDLHMALLAMQAKQEIEGRGFPAG